METSVAGMLVGWLRLALGACALTLVMAPPAHAVATVAADTTRALGRDPLLAGRSTSLVAGGLDETLLRFDVRGLGGPPARAVLRLRVTDATTEKLAVRVLPSAFGEDIATPPQLVPELTVIATVAGAGVRTWAEWDVTTAVRGDGDASASTTRSSVGRSSRRSPRRTT
jgi:hypothetical protein